MTPLQRLSKETSETATEGAAAEEVAAEERGAAVAAGAAAEVRAPFRWRSTRAKKVRNHRRGKTTKT
jgi:hypothetical protein